MDQPQAHPYATYLDIRYPALDLVDVPALVAACTDRWYNQTLCQVNGSVARLGVMQGEYHWHKHDNDDEFFSCSKDVSSSILPIARWSFRAGRDSSSPKGLSTERGRRNAPSS